MQYVIIITSPSGPQTTQVFGPFEDISFATGVAAGMRLRYPPERGCTVSLHVLLSPTTADVHAQQGMV